VLPRYMVWCAYHADQAGIRVGAGVGMSPDWTGWIVLHGMLLAAFLGVGCFVGILAVRAAARWLDREILCRCWCRLCRRARLRRWRSLW